VALCCGTNSTHDLYTSTPKPQSDILALDMWFPSSGADLIWLGPVFYSFAAYNDLSWRICLPTFSSIYWFRIVFLLAFSGQQHASRSWSWQTHPGSSERTFQDLIVVHRLQGPKGLNIPDPKSNTKTKTSTNSVRIPKPIQCQGQRQICLEIGR
jgi:hypothetical protein